MRWGIDMKFATFDGGGIPTAFYSPEINHDIPSGAVQITDDQWQEFISNNGLRRWDGKGVAEISAPPPPTPEQVLASLPPVSHAQIIAALIGADILTEAEGVDWITGTLPASVEAMIAALPAEHRTIARLRAIRPTYVVPTDPLVGALAASEGKSTDDLIAIFTAAAAL